MIKPVVGYEGKYAVSLDGSVYSLNFHRTGFTKILKAKCDKDGYLEVGLYKNGKKYYRIHRLVAMAFIPNPDNLPQVNHKDGVRDNNRHTNLEWCTARENIHHSWRAVNVKRTQRGEKNNATKLTNDRVVEIWRLKGKKNQVTIAKKFNVSEDVVSMIHRQINWKWLTDTLK